MPTKTKAPPKPAPVAASIAVMPVQGMVAIPRASLLRLALIIHNIIETQEGRHAKAA